MSRKYWTTFEESFIKKHISTMSISDLALHFDLPKAKIVDKIHKMGLNSKKSRGIIWSQTDDTLLGQHFEYAPKNFLMNLFPNRTWPSIVQRGLKTLHLNRKTQDKASINYNFFATWTRESAYIAGFIMADGHIHLGDCNYLQIEVAKKDKDILEKIATALNFEGKLYEMKTSIKFQDDNIKIISDLNRMGIPLKKKSYVASFPNSIPCKLERDYIRGLIDGDGWSRIAKDGYYNLGLCGTEEIVLEVKNRLNEDCSNNKVRKQGPNCWRFNIKGKKALRIAEWLYEDASIYLDRKYNVYQIAKQSFPVLAETQGGHGLKTSNS